jgi:hypothetical protein
MISFVTSFIKKSDRTFIVLFIHTCITVIGYCLFHILKSNDYPIPSDSNMIHYDAFWYYTIKELGYIYEPNKGNNLAFFPLFPLFWRRLNADPLTISIINYLLFLVSTTFLLKNRGVDTKLMLLLISFPSVIFCALPYSEALFFVFCSVVLIGYTSQSNLTLFIGFFGASLVRSVCMLFIPAILICELLNPKSDKESRLSTFYQILSSLLGFFMAAGYMGLETNKWFYFIEIQKYWNRHWIIPSFPLTTISPERVLGIDAITFILGLIAAYVCLQLLVAKFNTRQSSIAFPGKAVIFSALFMAGMSIMDLCFTYRSTEGATNIWSINRHVMSTPFSFIFLIWLCKDFMPSKKHTIIILIIIISGIYLTGVYQYPSFKGLTFYLGFFGALVVLKMKFKLRNLFWTYYLLAAFMQITFFSDYLFNHWLG